MSAVITEILARAGVLSVHTTSMLVIEHRTILKVEYEEVFGEWQNFSAIVTVVTMQNIETQVAGWTVNNHHFHVFSLFFLGNALLLHAFVEHFSVNASPELTDEVNCSDAFFGQHCLPLAIGFGSKRWQQVITGTA
jgi:hypothetical protein